MYKNSWLGAFCQLQSDHPRLKFEFLLQKIRLWSRVPCFQGHVLLLTKSDTGAIVNLSIYLKMCCKVSRLTSPTIRSILFPLQSTLTEKILRTFSCIKNLKPPNFSFFCPSALCLQIFCGFGTVHLWCWMFEDRLLFCCKIKSKN